MRFPWLFALALLALAVIAVLSYRAALRRPFGNVAWLSNMEGLRELPAYRRAQQAQRTGLLVFWSALITLSVSTAFVAAAPVEKRAENPGLASRDIVLCLDASGSMLPYDGEILRQFTDFIGSFEGERVALHLWSARTIIRFPLTDDYELMERVMREGATIIDRGYLGEEGDYVWVTSELNDYLEGIDSPNSEDSSLIGDGLATCVLGFDQRDTERSRTVILATDNEVMGDQIYTLHQAAQFAQDQDVDLIALNPGGGGPLTAEAEQMRYVVESVGGTFYDLSDPKAADRILDEIAAKQLAMLGGATEVKTVDVPKAGALWMMWSFLVLLAVAAVRKL